ncbi:MAG: hypothetical protein F8N39_07200 [Clostridiaceae bacterium]|nr:hypothetical protein [Clostridiaceae bacterium]
MTRGHPEDDLQIAIARLAKLILAPNVVFHHSVNEGKRGHAAAGIAKAMGQLAGFPAIYWGWWPGQSVFFEGNTEKGRFSQCHRDFAEWAQSTGHRWAACRSLDDFQQVIRDWGVPLKSRGTGKGIAA